MCTKNPSGVLGFNGTRDNPGAANLCGADGTVEAGTYNLTAEPTFGGAFYTWTCDRTDVVPSSTVPVDGSGPEVQVQIVEGTSVTCLAVYEAPDPNR
jgi:hypothetical protein